MDYPINKNDNQKRHRLREFIDEIDVSNFLSNDLINFLINEYDIDKYDYVNDKSEHRIKLKIYKVFEK